MKYLGKTVVILLVALSCFALVADVRADKNVGGAISSDTIWTKANSPYTLTADVSINVHVTLTIEAGVTVNLQGYSISTGWGYDEKTDTPLKSTFIAKGTEEDPIHFNGGDISLEHTANSIVQNAVLSATSIEVTYGTPTISYNTITGKGSGIGLTCGASESPKIIGNTISGWDIAIRTGEDTMGGGLRGYPQIQENTIFNNRIGILMILVDYGVGSWNFPKVINNTISANTQAGIQLQVSGPRWTGGSIDEITIEHNNIFNNPINAQAFPTSGIIAKNNWWGTTDSTAIKNTLSGEVVYEPFSNAPYNGGDVSIPTTPPNESTAATPDASISASTSPTPSVPEFSWLTILPLLLSIPIVLIIIRKRLHSGNF